VADPHRDGFASAVTRFFLLSERGTTLRTEILGGATTFATMGYIIVVNPAILKAAGLPVGPSTVATILTAVFGCLLMGLYANRPLAVAPDMGENAFIAFSLTAAGVGWKMALGAVFVSGAIFLLITVLGVRAWLAASLSASMKHSFGVGIGMFLAFLGLHQSGIVASGTGGPPVRLGDLAKVEVRLAIFGFILTAALMCWRVRGAILVGIVTTAVAGYLAGVGKSPEGLVALPFTGEYHPAGIAFQMEITELFQLQYLPVLLTLFLMSFLDTLGTLVGVGAAGGMLDEHGNLPQMERPMLVDAASCMFAAVVGTSTSGAFIESAAGVREGARTGLAAVTTGLLFALTLFFIPLVQPLQDLHYAYGPALIAVGVMMLGAVRKIDFDGPTEGFPAFVTLVMIVFTYNIANGLTAGLILYPVLKLLSGRYRELTAGSVVLGAACLVYYLFGLPH
jgi:AGZA family xanthine/uracil permease-like MFS transporter